MVDVVLECWGANIDFQAIVDLSAVVRYMTKYVCKVEKASNSHASTPRSMIDCHGG